MRCLSIVFVLGCGSSAEDTAGLPEAKLEAPSAPPYAGPCDHVDVESVEPWTATTLAGGVGTWVDWWVGGASCGPEEVSGAAMLASSEAPWYDDASEASPLAKTAAPAPATIPMVNPFAVGRHDAEPDQGCPFTGSYPNLAPSLKPDPQLITPNNTPARMSLYARLTVPMSSTGTEQVDWYSAKWRQGDTQWTFFQVAQRVTYFGLLPGRDYWFCVDFPNNNLDRVSGPGSWYDVGGGAVLVSSGGTLYQGAQITAWSTIL